MGSHESKNHRRWPWSVGEPRYKTVELTVIKRTDEAGVTDVDVNLHLVWVQGSRRQFLQIIHRQRGVFEVFRRGVAGQNVGSGIRTCVNDAAVAGDEKHDRVIFTCLREGGPHRRSNST